MELVDVGGSALPSRWWQHQAAFDGGVDSVVFGGTAAGRLLSACELGCIANWMRCCCRDALAFYDGCAGRDAAECMWGVRRGSLRAAQSLLGRAVDGTDPTASDALLRWLATASEDSNE